MHVKTSHKQVIDNKFYWSINVSQEHYNILTLKYFILAEEASPDDKNDNKSEINEQKMNKLKPFKNKSKPKPVIKRKRLR